MERVHTAFRDFAQRPILPLQREHGHWPDEQLRMSPSVWLPQFPGIPTRNTTRRNDDDLLVVELPLFTLGPRWFESYAYIGVGSPSQSIRVLLDTMSSDLSVLGYAHNRHELYDHDQSTSYVANDTLVLTALPGTDSRLNALGVLSQDHVALSPQLHVRNQIFSELQKAQATDSYFDETRADGWLGLARSRSQQALPGVPSLMSKLRTRLREQVVGIHLDPLSTGLVTFGGVNADRFHGNLSYVDVVPLGTSDGLGQEKEADRYWSFRVNYVLVDGTAVYVPPNGSVAVLDAVRPFIQGPREAVDAINAALGGQRMAAAGRAWQWQERQRCVPCHDPVNTTPVSVVLVLDGMALELNRRDLVVPAPSGHHDECVSLLVSPQHDAPMVADWSIGAPIMQSFYTALDFGDETRRPPRIGFARSKLYTPPQYSAYDSLWLVLLAIVVVLIIRSLGRRVRSQRGKHEQLHEEEIHEI